MVVPALINRYFEGFEDFLPLNGIEFYYYDQLDSTNSEKPNDPCVVDDSSGIPMKWRQSDRGLGLDQFYLLGHSWGGLLAIEYALKYQQHLKGLVISNMAASADSFVKHVSKIRAQIFAADLRGSIGILRERRIERMTLHIKTLLFDKLLQGLHLSTGSMARSSITESGRLESKRLSPYCKDEVNSKRRAA